jgi:hypothetical protein
MTYQLRGMTLTDTSYEGKTPPRMEELYAVLQSMQ